MPLPHWVARFNKRVTNRFLEPIVRRSSGFAIVLHRGRRSGRLYTTPVNIFDADDGAAIVALTYGTNADWVRNVLTGGGDVERRGLRTPILQAELIGRSGAWPFLPLWIRIALRILTVRDFLRITAAD